ncbi:hypothetical protein [Actinokineospora sp.]|uniref:hypothetical protein n=1 Tax=Actinokineospora sp. TaxID=1872133 RepID=UPI003D6C564A
MTTSLEELDPDVQQQLREHWGVEDLGSLTQSTDDTDYDAVMAFFEANRSAAAGSRSRERASRIPAVDGGAVHRGRVTK